MTEKNFQQMYDDVILMYADELLEIAKQSGINCLNFNSRKAKKAYYFYENKRRYIRRYFMNFENQPMDRHKIGAVMMYAILKSKPFTIKMFVPKIPNKLLMANEYLSFYVALSIVESYRIDDCISSGKCSLEKCISENGASKDCCNLILPETYHNNEKTNLSGDIYIENICKALYYIKNVNNFDIFAYSNILFLLEKYTDKIKNFSSSDN